MNAVREGLHNRADRRIKPTTPKMGLTGPSLNSDLTNLGVLKFVYQWPGILLPLQGYIGSLVAK
jgi:hypothetical protein